MRASDEHGKEPRLFSALCIVAIVGLICITAWRWATQQQPPARDPQVMNEIRQLAVAIENFRAKFGIYPPSRIKLCEKRDDYDQGSKLDRESLKFIERVWPRIKWKRGLDWNGNGKIESKEAGGAIVLEGDQCLVFFLGGIPSASSPPCCLGFSNNPDDPTSLLGNVSPLFYEFDSSRLVTLRANRFYSYLDCYRSRPYAYFSSYGIRDGYNPYYAELRNSDCSLLGAWPYATSLGPPVHYVNPNSCQIISAGRDKLFGAGTVLPHGQSWTSETANQIDPSGRDDLTNFCDRALGSSDD